MARAACAGKSVPTDPSLYAQVKADAKRRFPVYPSIYANSWLVQEYKRRGGRYACTGQPTRGGLRRWYKEKWVDLSRPLPGGGWAECGRPSLDQAHWREKYPKCRPLAEAKKFTAAQVRSAVTRKRKAVSKSRRGKPTYVPTVLTQNPLKQGCSAAVRSENMRELIHAGYPQKQAVAIAYAVQRRARCRKLRRNAARAKRGPGFVIIAASLAAAAATAGYAMAPPGSRIEGAIGAFIAMPWLFATGVLYALLGRR